MFVIGTAGHVDHGKSTLVEALTGIDPDRLREEKTRGMTIDLGFAWLTLPSGRTVSIVDVPGHERFIKNMLAGAGGIDLALLVVAADDGVMPQTREHLAILDLLGVSRGVVALAKCDLAEPEWLALVETEIAALLRGFSLESSPVVRCSARNGDGLDALIHAIDDAIGELPPKRNVGRPRLPIDRVFTIGGFGTVVTGTLIDGEFSGGDEVEVVPGGLRGRIRGLQSHKDSVEHALPGTRTAINLAGIERGALRRGLVLARPGALAATHVVDVRLRAVAPLRHNLHVTLHSGADEANAKVRLLDADELQPGGEAWAQIKLETPVAVQRGDHFVLRTPNDTVGGGTVVDTRPKRHRRHDAVSIRTLNQRGSDAPPDRVLECISRMPLTTAAAIAAEVALPADVAGAAIDDLVAAGTALRIPRDGGALIALASFAHQVREQALTALDGYHETHSLRGGMPLEEFRARLRVELRDLLALASQWEDVRIDNATAARNGFTPSLSGAQRTAAETYVAALRAAGERPPAQSIDPELLAYLAERGDVVDTGDGVVFEAAAFDAMRTRICVHIERHGSITLAGARDLLGSSRRHVQALLEHLDRLRVTRRVGDTRVLR
jgi:selenocysteine-specific elongation factor